MRTAGGDGEAGGRSLDVAGGAIEWREWAAGDDGRSEPPLVLLHEGLGSVGLWRGFPDQLAAATGRRVVAFSRHGHGRSGPFTQARGVDYLHHEARVVLPQVLEMLGCDGRPVLVGHSDGASIALIAAGEGVVDPSGLVVMAPHVVVEDVALEGIAAAREAYETTGLPQRMARHHDDADAMFWAWHDTWRSDGFSNWDIRDVLPAIACPVLAIQGVDDRYGTMRQLDLVEHGVRGSVTRAELVDCDHAPHLEQPAATLTAITTWLPRRGS